VPFSDVRDAAQEFRGLLEASGLTSFALLTGGKGIHVIAPLTGRNDWADVKAFAKGLAAKIAGAAPERYINVMSKAQRTGRIFVDWLRNERGATAIAPYSPRARAGAPLAWPVSWRQLASVESASAFTVRSAVAHPPRATPWDGYKDVRQSISPTVLKAVSERATPDRG
jgi:bifunctional non-homologous end joining protein LigD